MTTAQFEDLGNGIYCIETALHRHEMVACYLIYDSGEAALIDNGTLFSVPNIIASITAAGLNAEHVKYIIPTHVHLDHAGATGELMQRCPNATLITHSKGLPHMLDPRRLQAGATAVYGEAAFKNDYGHLTAVDAARGRAAVDGEQLTLGQRQLTLLDTPGHANHHICVFDTHTKTVFSGDTFGISYREFDTDKGTWGFAPSTPVAFDPDAWQTSLDKIMSLEPQAACLTHFNRITDISGMAQQVRASIEAMRQFALQEEKNNDANDTRRTQRLSTKIRHLFTQQLKEHGTTLSEEHINALLDIDIELNAQGLDVWLSHRAKAVPANHQGANA